MGFCMRYLVNLSYDAEYKGYVTEIPELPGCMSQGRTIKSAVRNAAKAIALFVDATRKMPVKPARKMTIEVAVVWIDSAPR